jgi:Mn2+/Fe2+ NRAMP family transporter
VAPSSHRLSHARSRRMFAIVAFETRESGSGVKKLVNLALGVVTSIGGFVEVGSISTAAQAGADFRFALLWSIAAAGFILAVLIEMSGRLAAVGHRSMVSAVRERFGFHFQLWPLSAELVTDLLLLTAELGGAAIAARMLTGIGAGWWIAPVALLGWLVLWLGNFSIVENGLGLLGMVTLSFVVAAWRLHPNLGQVAAGFVPRLPRHDAAHYWFIAVSIVGATISPYLLNFYSSGAVEEKWSQADVWVNRVTAFLGMGFGTVVSMGVLVTAAVVLAPQGIKVNTYDEAALMFLPVFGKWAITIFALSLGIGCFGAAVEIALNVGYLLAQSFGWSWGINKRRANTARFSGAFTVVLALSILVSLLRIDPLQLTLISVALTVVILPFVVLPFVVLMNEDIYLKDYRSGPIGNAILAVFVVLAAAMAAVVIPLEIMGS